jgi:hypothetical protein
MILAQLAELKKSIEAKTNDLNHDQAVLFVLKQRPAWSFEVASKLVDYAMQSGSRK